MGCVYSILFPNDKVYIGMTTKTIEERRKQHINSAKVKNYPVYNALNKFDQKDIRWMVLYEDDSLDELCYVEQWYIKEFNTQERKCGYNLESGGVSGKWSQESREKLSNSKRKENHHFYGKRLSEEHIKKLSEARKGKNNPMFGKKHTEETKQKIKEKMKGRKLSEESKKKISESSKKQKHSPERKRNSRQRMLGSNNPSYGKYGLLNPTFLIRGEDRPTAKLNWDKVDEIRERYNRGGITHRELAKIYGVGKSTIGAILTFKTWNVMILDNDNKI